MISEPVPKEILQLIGTIMVQFNRLDAFISLAIIEVTGNDFLNLKSHTPFIKMAFQPRKTLLDILIANMDNIVAGSPLSRYRDTLRQPIDDVAKERNAIAHSLWDMEEGKIYRRRFRLKRHVLLESVEVSRLTLTKTLDELGFCVEGMATLTLYIKTLNFTPQLGQNENVSVESLRKELSEM